MLLKTAGGLSLILALNFVIQAKGWRGIVPLHSTRADVEQLLGPPDRKGNKPVVRYDLEKEQVYIIYSREPCSDGSIYAKWAVPPGTVVGIRVVPKKKLLLSELQLDAAQYKVTHVRGVLSYTYYTDEGEGVQFDVSDGHVNAIYYFQAAEDEHLRCKTYTGGKYPGRAPRLTTACSGARTRILSCILSRASRPLMPGVRCLPPSPDSSYIQSHEPVVRVG